MNRDEDFASRRTAIVRYTDLALAHLEGFHDCRGAMRGLLGLVSEDLFPFDRPPYVELDAWDSVREQAMVCFECGGASADACHFVEAEVRRIHSGIRGGSLFERRRGEGPDLRWDPPIEDMAHSSTLLSCVRSPCRALVAIDPRSLIALVPSHSGRHVALWTASGEHGSVLHIVDVRSGRDARVELPQIARGRVEWSKHDHVFLTHSEVMGSVSVEMFSVGGRHVLGTGGSAIETSPDERYLAAYPSSRGMPALRPHFFLYRVRDGRELAMPELPSGWVSVRRVIWSHRLVVVTTVDDEGVPTTTRAYIPR